MVLRVNFPPGKGAGYHTHSLDQLSVIVEDTTNAGQLLGGQPDAAAPEPARQRGLYGLFQEIDDAQYQECRPDTVP